MPLYEYRCACCERTVEFLVRSAAERPACPECGAAELEKLLSIPASPAVRDGGRPLPVAGAGEGGCGAPRCCGGGCAME